MGEGLGWTLGIKCRDYGRRFLFILNTFAFYRMKQERIILGIDPGTTVMGWGVIRAVGQKPECVALGILELHKYDNHYLKLQKIFERVIGLIEQFHPDEMALEAPFFGKNVQSMLKLGRAQGVAMAAGLSRDLPITEYAPLKIKMAVTGNGQASKEQVAGMLKQYLKLDEIPKKLDATDGLAAALCHFFQNQSMTQKKSYNSWKDFVNKNPKRAKK